jgi:hypothetical protein
MRPEHFKNMRDCGRVFVGGSNLLGNSVFSRQCLKRGRLRRWRQWKVSLGDARRIQNAILLGASWWRYEGKTGFYTRSILRAALSEDVLHSVRDEYTKEKLKLVGIENVVNTGCPTMWPLENLNPVTLPTEKANNVLTMLTGTQKAPELDAKLLEVLFAKYRHVYCWPQGGGDRDYVVGLSFPITVLEHSLGALEDFAHEEKKFDYIGTRLHGGIFCLNAGRRVLILRTDNRATEISKDTGLNAVAWDDFDSILRWIDGPSKTEIRINSESIHRWRNQFKTAKS